jgi:hypothetical protein
MNMVRSPRRTRGLRKRAAQSRLGSAGESGDQHGGRTVVAASQHGVEALDAAGNALVAHFGVHADERARNGNVEAVPADQEGRFVLIEG